MAEPPKGSYRDRIYKDYALAFPDIAERLAAYEVRASKAPVRRKMLKDLDEQMFPTGYPRFCTHEPSVLETQEEIEEAIAEGRDVMIFPLYGEGIRRAYVSNHPSRPFVGLKLNSLSNRLTFPYLPCCYPVDQKDNPNRPRYKYEHQNDEEEGEIIEKRTHRPKMFISNKAMKRNAYGILPTLVDKFLRTIDRFAFPVHEDKIPYARQGTLRDKNSVLDALIKVVIDYYTDLDKEDDKIQYKRMIISRLPILSKLFDGYEDFDNSEKSSFLGRVRSDLSVFVDSNITAQSTFNLELRTVREELAKDSSYLDIKLFWRILEEVFHVNIILFRRNEEYPQGVLGSPNFLQEYLQYHRQKSENKWRFTIFLFETIGAELDNLDFPQIEIIKRFTYSDPHVNVFSWFDGLKDKTLLKRVYDCFDEIFSYNGHPNLPISNIFISKPVAQCADFYGKIRLIQFAGGVCVMTEPLPAMDRSDLDEKLAGGCSLVPVDLDKARSFLVVEGVTDIRKVVIGDRVVGLQCSRSITTELNEGIQDSVSFYIPVIPVKDDLKDFDTAPLTAPSFLNSRREVSSKEEKTISLLEDFNSLARLARYIVEYVLWIFSKWHKDNRGDLYDKEYISKFAADKFQIVKGHEYPSRISRRLDISLHGVMNGSKIIVPSNDVRNRLVFALQIRITQNEREVLSYYSRSYIQRYYQDVTDFEMSESNVILFGQDMVLSWIDSRLPHYILHDRIVYPICSIVPDTMGADESPESKKEREKLCDLIIEKGLVIDPYFIRLQEMDDDIYIVQQATSLSNALYICQVWYEQGYNIGPNSSGKVGTDVGFRYVAYNDAYDYEVENINGGDDSYTILQYKYNNEVFTMALLKY